MCLLGLPEFVVRESYLLRQEPYGLLSQYPLRKR